MTEINLKLFGLFRDLEPSGAFRVRAPLPMTVAEFKTLLTKELNSRSTSTVDIPALLKISALATEQRVLNDQDLVTAQDSLALLPPVCGG